MDEGLAAGLGKKISKLVWQNRKPSTREAMLKELKKVGANFKRRVLIVQPHVTSAAHEDAQRGRHACRYEREGATCDSRADPRAIA